MRFMYDEVYDKIGAHADIDKVFDAIPDGFAKIDGHWLELTESEMVPLRRAVKAKRKFLEGI